MINFYKEKKKISIQTIKIVFFQREHEYSRLYCAVPLESPIPNSCKLKKFFKGSFFEEIIYENFKYLVFISKDLKIKNTEDLLYIDPYLNKAYAINSDFDNFNEINNCTNYHITKLNPPPEKVIIEIKEDTFKEVNLNFYLNNNSNYICINLIFRLIISMENNKIKDIVIDYQQTNPIEIHISFKSKLPRWVVIHNNHSKAIGEKTYKLTNYPLNIKKYIKNKMRYLNINSEITMELVLDIRKKIGMKFIWDQSLAIIKSVKHIFCPLNSHSRITGSIFFHTKDEIIKEKNTKKNNYNIYNIEYWEYIPS